MTKHYLIILGLILTIISCREEITSNYPEYYRTYNQVLRLEKEEKFKEAFKLFQESEKLVEFIPVQHLLEGRNLSILTKNCELVHDYFQKAVDNGFEFEQYNFSSNLCLDISNTSVKRTKGFDQQYKKEIETIFQADQAIRNNPTNENMQKTDSLNIDKLLSLIEEKGYPSSKKVGNKAASNAFIVLLHFDSDVGNKILKPIIEKAYHQGMLSPENYAWIIDRRRNWGPKKLDPYYFQLPSGKYFELTEEEISEIDDRRYSIGLRPLSEINITKTENGGISIQF